MEGEGEFMEHVNRETLRYERKKSRIGMVLSDLVALTRKLKENEYPYDRDGKIEFEADLEEAARLALETFNEFMNGSDL